MMGALLSALLFALAALLHLLAALLDRSGRIRLHHWAEEAGPSLHKLYDRRRRFLTFRALLVVASGTALLGAVLLTERTAGGLALALGVGMGAVVLAEAATRIAVSRWSEEALSGLTPVYRSLAVLLGPLLALTPESTALDAGPEDDEDEEDDDASEDEIQAFLQVGAVEGILEPGEEDLVLRIIDFGDTVVKSVMTPRIDMVCLAAEEGLEGAADLFLSSKHSRIPVYRDSVDTIVGILHIRDVLAAVRAGNGSHPVDLAAPTFFVPDSKPVSQLLGELQARHQQMAIVVDEFGGTAGLVTLEDLLEEIVGEIADEHEPPAADPQQVVEGVWRMEGSADLEVLEELFDIDLEEEPYETVGGMVFGLVGAVPEPGQSVVSHGLELTVEEVEDRRVRQVRVERLETSEPTGEEGA
ncbi:MAG: hemolysin family protein [Thermoanaerobaculia bacterium]